MGAKRKKRIIKIAAHLLIIATFIFLENQNEIMAQNIRVMMNNTNEIKFDTTKIQHLKKIRRFVFPIGKNPSSFGYHYYPESGEIDCVECIRVINNSIYLIDQAHKNIKKIDIPDGKLHISNNLKRERTYLNSIGYLNNSLYVFTNFNIVFNLDLNLNYRGSIPLKDYNGDVYVYSENKDELIFYSLYTFTPVNSKEKLFMKIDKSGQCTPYYIKKDKNQLDNLYQMPQGQAGYEIQVGQKLYFQTNNLAYEIPVSFKKLNDYSCIDIDYSDKYVVSFKANDKKIEITVYEY